MVTGELERSAGTIARPGTGTIAGIIGPEGAGKDCLMTRFATVFWEMGYDVYAFPGYHLLNPIRHSKDPNKKFKVISQEIMPEEWINLPMNLHDILILISEADSHFNSLESQYEIAKNMVSLMKQRRKRSLTILYNVQNWGWFNNRMRWLTHILFQCTDIYWHTRNSENPIPRGQKIGVIPFDCKGFYTGREWTQGMPFTFDATKVWENFDTYETTTQEQSVGSVRVHRSRRDLDIINGQVVIPGSDKAPAVNMKGIEALADRYTLNRAQRNSMVSQAISVFLEKGDTIPRNILLKAIEAMGIVISTPQLGNIIHGMGGTLKSGRNGGESYYYFVRQQQEAG